MSTPRRSHLSSSERGEQRVGQEQDGEGSGDLPGSGGPVGVEEQSAYQAALEQAVAERAHGAQFDQPPEFG
jgi:hypothetical protein